MNITLYAKLKKEVITCRLTIIMYLRGVRGSLQEIAKKVIIVS